LKSNRQKRVGRRIRPESLKLEELLKEEIKKEFAKHNVIRILCDEKGWSRSDYDRIFKWLDNYNRRVEIGLLIDALCAVGADWEEVFRRTLKRREKGIKT